MKTYILVILLLLSLVYFPLTSKAQVGSGGDPYTFNSTFSHQTKLRKSAVNALRVKDLDMNIIERELNELNKCKDCSGDAYYGKEVEVGVNFFDKAQNFESDDKEIWLLNIESDEAKGYQFIFSQFDLPEGGRLFIYNEDRSMILGSFTSKNNREDGTFLTQYINGNNISIEYSEPKNVERKCRIYIDKVVYIFSDIFNPSRGPFSEKGSAACQINTICELDDDVKVKSTVMILEKSQNDYWGVCTGVLLADARYYMSDNHPKLLTSNHCMESETGEIFDPGNWVFLFRHESIWCSGSGFELPKDNVKSALGAKVLSRDIGSKKTDYLLLELINTFDNIAHFDIALAGWSSHDQDATSSSHLIGIHHPQGDVKKISISYTKPITASWNENKEKNHWAVRWGKGGRTEPASSGSPLFNNKNQVVGFLHGGVHEEICDYKHLDYYGKMSDAYKDGGLANYIGLSYQDPISYVTSSIFHLNVKTKFIPETPSNQDNIYIQASADNAMTKIHWTWIINKEAGDFTEYPSGHSKVTTIKETTSNFERISKIGPYKLNIGTYLVRLYANDENGLSKIETFALTVSPYIDPCIYGGIYMDNHNPIASHKDVYVERWDGSSYMSYASFNVMHSLSTPYNLISSGMDVCHDRYDMKWRKWYPKYDGIRQISMYLHYFDKDGVKKTKDLMSRSFLYTEALAHLGPFYTHGSYNLGFEHVGKNTIETRVVGGYHNYENSTPNGKLQSLTPINNKDKYDAQYFTEVFVVDCGSEVAVASKKSPLIANKESDIKRISAAVINMNSMTFEKGEEYDAKAFYRINLKPGMHIKEGAVFHATVKPCSESVKHTRSSENYSIIDSEPLNEIIKKNDVILIYPNPTTGIINIEAPNDETIVYGAEVYSLDGRMVRDKNSISNPYSFDISNQANGLYIIRVLTNQGVSSHKVILRK